MKMIIVVAKVITKQGKQNNFLNLAQNCINETLKEKGNISYTLLAETGDDRKFTFLEEWVTQEDLDIHMQTSHFKQFGVGLGEIIDAPLEINIFEAQKK